MTHRYRTFEPTSSSSMYAADFYQLPLPFSSIHYIDNVSDFRSCMASILQVIFVLLSCVVFVRRWIL